MDHISQVGETSNRSVSKGVVYVELDGFDNNVRIYRYQDNEGMTRISEEIVNCVQHLENFPLLNNIQAVHDDGQPGVTICEAVQSIDHPHQESQLIPHSLDHSL